MRLAVIRSRVWVSETLNPEATELNVAPLHVNAMIEMTALFDGRPGAEASEKGVDARDGDGGMNTPAHRLAAEDRAENAGLLSPDDRLTCHVHARWIHQCVSSALHVNQITRHRWCRDCAVALNVVVDELTRTVTIRCPRCGDGDSAATTRLLAACRASLAASRPLHLSAVA
jgi:hypothetical protein